MTSSFSHFRRVAMERIAKHNRAGAGTRGGTNARDLEEGYVGGRGGSEGLQGHHHEDVNAVDDTPRGHELGKIYVRIRHGLTRSGGDAQLAIAGAGLDTACSGAIGKNISASVLEDDREEIETCRPGSAREWKVGVVMSERSLVKRGFCFFR